MWGMWGNYIRPPDGEIRKRIRKALSFPIQALYRTNRSEIERFGNSEPPRHRLFNSRVSETGDVSSDRL